MTRLVIVRHTEPDESVRGRCYGRMDCGLSEAGLAHTFTLAESLRGHSIQAVYASPLRRAVLTAEPIGEILGVPLAIDGELVEMNCGDLEGLLWEEIEELHPGFAFWHTVPTAEWRFVGGESFAEVTARGWGALETIRACHEGETALVVAHSGVIRAVLAHALSIPTTEVFRLFVAYGGVSVIEWVDDEPIVRMVNARAL